MNRDELLALPAAIDVETAARALSIGRSLAYELVKTGAFPVPVLKLGTRFRIPTAPLLEALGITPDMSEAAAPTAAIATTNEDVGGPRDDHSATAGPIRHAS